MEADDLTDFDQAISFLDTYGLFQIIIILLLSLTAAPVGFSSMTAVFVSDTPEFRCKVSLGSAENSSWVGDWVWDSRCSRDRDHANWTGDAGLSNGTEPCVDGWDFSSQTHTSTIVTEWGLVCENTWKVPFSTSLFFAGYLCGSFINGHLSDRGASSHRHVINLNGNIYLNCFISAAIDSFAYVAIWVLVDRLPRPTLLSGTMMFSGATLLILKLIPEDNTIVLQVLGLVGKIGVGSAFSIIFLFVTELMPTVVRNMGMGVGATSGFLGTMICPYILYTGVYMKILPFLIFGAACIVASLLSMLLPDTRYSKLPDLISEVKPIRCCGCTKRIT